MGKTAGGKKMCPGHLSTVSVNKPKSDSKLTAHDLRKKIGVKSAFGGKTLIDLSKEGK